MFICLPSENQNQKSDCQYSMDVVSVSITAPGSSNLLVSYTSRSNQLKFVTRCSDLIRIRYFKLIRSLKRKLHEQEEVLSGKEKVLELLQHEIQDKEHEHEVRVLARLSLNCVLFCRIKVSHYFIKLLYFLEVYINLIRKI